MGKSPDAFRTISEVADLLDVPAHVLRFWESRFTQIKPIKRAGGRRYYRRSDILLLDGIRRLLHDDGFTIRGVQKLLREEGVRRVASHGRVDIGGDKDDSDLIADILGEDVPEAPLAMDVEPEVAQILPFPRRTPSTAEGESPAAQVAAPGFAEPAEAFAPGAKSQDKTTDGSQAGDAQVLSEAEIARRAAMGLEDTGPLIEAYLGRSAGAETPSPTSSEAKEPPDSAALAPAPNAPLAEESPASPQPSAADRAANFLAGLAADPEDGDARFALPPLPLGRLHPGLPGLRPLYLRLCHIRAALGESTRRFSARS